MLASLDPIYRNISGENILQIIYGFDIEYISFYSPYPDRNLISSLFNFKTFKSCCFFFAMQMATETEKLPYFISFVWIFFLSISFAVHLRVVIRNLFRSFAA